MSNRKLAKLLSSGVRCTFEPPTWAPFFKQRWDRWIRSSDGRRAADGTTSGQYLENRLHGAFSAGWRAAMEELGQTRASTGGEKP